MTDENNDDIFDLGSAEEPPPDSPEAKYGYFQPDHSKGVLFVDLLGFADLTEQSRVDADDFRVLDRADKDDFLRVMYEDVNNPLVEMYSRFNIALDNTIRYGLKAHDELTVIAFSDSAFIAADSLYVVSSVAHSLMHAFIREGIPARMGIAFGSFLVLRFRSDISLRAGTHAAQFVGTGAVWAHAACEKSGLKGLRAFFHPSAMAVMEAPWQKQSQYDHPPALLSLDESEIENRVGVTHELNYLTQKHRPFDITVMETVTALADKAPQKAKVQYEATLRAHDRMRAAYGRDYNPVLSTANALNRFISGR